jgi:hypothetical protein
MKIFLIYPSAKHGWSLLREGEDHRLQFADKEQAISHGRHIALANRPSMLRVETWYGSVEATWFFGDKATGRSAAPAYRQAELD